LVELKVEQGAPVAIEDAGTGQLQLRHSAYHSGTRNRKARLDKYDRSRHASQFEFGFVPGESMEASEVEKPIS